MDGDLGRAGWRWRLATLLTSVGLVSLVGCGDARHAAGASGATLHPCAASEANRSALRVADRVTYIEPQVLMHTGAETLLAGSPTYEWFRGPSGISEYEENELFGVLDAAGSIRAVRRPGWLGPVATVRVARVTSGRLLWLFDEVDTMSFREMRSVRVSFAEWESGVWTESGTIPIAEGATYSFLASSDLVTLRGAARWILVTTSPRGETSVLHYARTPDGWRSAVLDTLAVEDVSLVARSDTAWVALTGPDSAVGARSVRVGNLDTAARRVYVAEPGARIVDVALTAGDTTVAASWISIRTDFAREAWAAVDIDMADPTTSLIENDTEQVEPVTLPGGRVVWLTHRLDPLTFARTLNVHALGPDGAPYRIASFAYPFEGYFAAVASGPSEILVAGPETPSGPANRIVRSLLIRLFVDCR